MIEQNLGKNSILSPWENQITTKRNIYFRRKYENIIKKII